MNRETFRADMGYGGLSTLPGFFGSPLNEPLLGPREQRKKRSSKLESCFAG